jgi:uncharacterized phage protein gp47/JayE
MPWFRPKLVDLVAGVREDMRVRLEAHGSPVLRKALVKILATVWAGAVHMLHGHQEWISRQAFPQTAEREALIRYARPYGLSPTPATFAAGPVVATGTNGQPVPEGTRLRRADGVVYAVTTGGTIASGTATVQVEAVLPGAAGSADAETVLSFESPLAGVDTEAEVDTGGLIGGNDEEDTEAFRARLIARLRQPPQGGAAHDYVAWALAVPGVTRAWVYPHEGGLGTVTVRFARDDDDDPIPSAGEVTVVQAALDAERPVTAEVTAAAPTSLALDLTLSITPDTPETRAAVLEEVADLLERDAAPGDGETDLGKIKLSQLRVAIGSATGVTDYNLTVPAADLTPGLGQLVFLGTVTWL